MTIFHQEPFDSASSTTGDASSADMLTYMQDKYSGGTYTSGADIRAQAGWGGVGSSLSMGKDGSASSNFARFPIPETGTVHGQFAYNPRNTAVTDEIFTLRHLADGVQHVTIQMLTGTKIRALRGSGFGTTLGTTVDVLRLGRWNHIRFKITISDTVGEVTIWVNDIQVLNLTSQDTRNAGAGDDCDTIDLVGAAAVLAGLEGETCFDDFVIGDAEITDVLKVEDLVPDSAGDNTDWTPSAGSNFQNVEEVPKDGDTTYNETSTLNNIDLYNMGALSVITANVAGVQVNLDVRPTAGTPSLRTKVKTGTTTADGATQGTADTSNYDTFSEIEEVDPDTAIAWTVGGVNGMQCGLEHL